MTTTELEPQFAVTVRGYDRAHVDEYVDTLREWLANATQRMENAERENGRLREEVVHLRARLADQDRQLRGGTPKTIEALGDRVSAILLLAEEGASTLRADADAEAVAIIGRARQEAADLVAAAEARRTEMQAFIATAADRASEIVREGEARAMETAARLISQAEAQASSREAAADAREREAEAAATAREQQATAREREAEAKASAREREAEAKASAREREAEAKAIARLKDAEATAAVGLKDAENKAAVRLQEAAVVATSREAEARETALGIVTEAEDHREKVLSDLHDQENAIGAELLRLAGERDEVVQALTRLREALHRTITGLPDAPPPSSLGPAPGSDSGSSSGSGSEAGGSKRVRLPVGISGQRPAL